MSSDSVVRTNSLTAGYGHSIVADDITLNVAPGEILVLIGPNGAGKSTLLKTIAGQLSPISGTVFIKERDIKDIRGSDIAKEMSVMLTGRPGSELMSIEDMVSTGRYPYTGRLGILSKEDKRVVEEALKLVDIYEIKDCWFEEVSDGQRQRAMIARAICQESEILILDEPASFLDIHHKLELIGILKRLAKEKAITVIMSLHELDLAQKCADNILCISHGRVDRYGTPAEIFSSLNDNYIQKLYDIKKGTFIGEYGSIELERPDADPDLFVIGGAGSGIEIYRKLQREEIAFYAGIIHENDIELPVARALASEVVTAKAFEEIGSDEYSRALELMNRCSKVLCAVKQFGQGNAGNRLLAREAEKSGKLIGIEGICQK